VILGDARDIALNPAISALCIDRSKQRRVSANLTAQRCAQDRIGRGAPTNWSDTATCRLAAIMAVDVVGYERG